MSQLASGTFGAFQIVESFQGRAQFRSFSKHRDGSSVNSKNNRIECEVAYISRGADPTLIALNTLLSLGIAGKIRSMKTMGQEI